MKSLPTPIHLAIAAMFLVGSSNGMAADVPTPEAAAKRLRELILHRGASDLTFKQVSQMAGRLSDKQVAAIGREVGVGRTDGMRGWVRSAVLAEWGGRDFKAAMTHLSGDAQLDSGHQQALYAVFRGSRPAEPEQALLHLPRMFREYPSAVGAFTRIWAMHDLRELFSEMAAKEPEQTWQLLTADKPKGPEAEALAFLSSKFSRKPLSSVDAKSIAMEGFWRGLRDPTIKMYAGRFRQVWNAPKVVSATREFRKQMGAHVSSFNWNPPSTEESIGREAAVAMARFDPQAAVDWVGKSGPNADIEKDGRINWLLTEWAWRNPARALAELKKGPYGKRQQEISTGILRGDASLAPELVRLPGHGGSLSFVLGNSFPAAATLMEYDMYPVPGRGDVLPSHQVRYDAFKEAIRIIGLPGQQLKQLNRSLNGAFRYTVQSAETEYQLAQNN